MHIIRGAVGCSDRANTAISNATPGHLLKMCKSVDDPSHIGICLETGHLNISQRGNQYNFIMQAGDRLKAMHVHDNRGE